MDQEIVGNQNGLGPPKYLSVLGHENCLGTYNPTPNYKAKCLPSAKPLACIDDSWKILNHVFDGEDCPVMTPEMAPERFPGPEMNINLVSKMQHTCLATLIIELPDDSIPCLPVIQPPTCSDSDWEIVNRPPIAGITLECLLNITQSTYRTIYLKFFYERST